MRTSLVLLLSATLLLPGCLWDLRPAELRDPALRASNPGTHRGDSYDRGALRTLQDHGASIPAGSLEPSGDENVVREALRIAPPSYPGSGSSYELRTARTLVLRRRPRATYAALGPLMRHADPERRAGSIDLLGHYDSGRTARSGSPDDVPPPMRGQERDEALRGATRLLLHDPAPIVREAASYAFLGSLEVASMPAPHAFVSALARETVAEQKGRLVRLMRKARVPARVRIPAINRHAPTMMDAWAALDGTVVAANRAILEATYARGSPLFKQALLREAEDLEAPQPWLEGLVLLGLAEPEKHLREAAAHLSLDLPVPSAQVLAALRRVSGTTSWAAEALKQHSRDPR